MDTNICHNMVVFGITSISWLIILATIVVYISFCFYPV